MEVRSSDGALPSRRNAREFSPPPAKKARSNELLLCFRLGAPCEKSMPGVLRLILASSWTAEPLVAFPIGPAHHMHLKLVHVGAVDDGGIGIVVPQRTPAVD